MKSKSFSSPKRLIIVVVVAVLLLAAGQALAADQPETKPEFGALSVLPPLVAIALCIITKEVIPSLFIGAWVAGTMLSGWNPINGFGKSVEFLWNSLGDP
jgi:opacity protein-like surface antigen